MNIGLDKIRIDCGTQSRTEIKHAVIDHYAKLLKDGVVFPAVKVFFDGTAYYLADGYHRYFANKVVGSPGINCDVVNGTLRDAQLYSFGANHDHGLQRTIADKVKAVTTMLQDLEWSDWSDREIARACNVSHPFVAKIRAELGQKKQDSVKFERDGKVMQMDTKNKTERKLPKENLETLPDAENATDHEKEELFEAVDLLKAENQALTDKLAVVSISPEQAERDMAQSLIADLRAQIKLLEVELRAVKTSRDTYQAEKAQLMKQNAMLQKKLKKYEDEK